MYIYSILGGIMLYAGYVNRSKLYQEGINQGWNIVYYYHMTKEQISSILYKIKKEEEDEIQEEETKILIGWDGDVETTLSWDNEQDIDKFLQKNIENMELLYYFDKYYMKQMHSIDDFKKKCIPSKEFFMSIEFIQGDYKIDIKNHIHGYLVVGNKLFTKTFLKWYMRRYYGITLKDNYQINIMDTDINYINLKNGEKYIDIKDQNNYELINI